MNARRMIGWLLIVVLLVGCDASVPEETAVEVPQEAESLVDKAIEDLAARVGVDPGDIVVEGVAETEFPDASLGVPEPGTSYAQVITPGYIIRLRAGGKIYEYRAAENRVILATEGPAADVE